MTVADREQSLRDRTWPDRISTGAPRWCATDLCDVRWAGLTRRVMLFDRLVDAGCREIAVGRPGTSAADLVLLRRLVELDRIPHHVVVEVVTGPSESQIRQTCQALTGVRRSVLRLADTAEPHRGRSGRGRAAARECREARDRLSTAEAARACLTYACVPPGSSVGLAYSPPPDADLRSGVDSCTAVARVWCETPIRPIITGLPPALDGGTPHLYADRIEWLYRRLLPSRVVLSLRPRDPLGAMCAACLGLPAGARRIEGALLIAESGESHPRLAVAAGSLAGQGVDPGLDLPNVRRRRGAPGRPDAGVQRPGADDGPLDDASMWGVLLV